MITAPRNAVATAVALLMVLPIALDRQGNAEAAKPQKQDDAKNLERMVDQGVAFLKSTQTVDGTWSKTTSPGITGIVLTSLFRSGKVTAKDPVALKGLKYIESVADPKEGHLAAVEGKGFHRNYITSVNLVALKSANAGPKYEALIAAAAKYLKDLQWDEGEGKTAKDLYYGGVGYGPGTRPDLSNSQFFLDALKFAGVPASDPVYQKALIFISRCQNLKSEHNNQPWAGKINDGSFIYVLGAPKGKAVAEDAARPGSGSMTYAGLKSFLQCGLSRDDPRFKKAMEWVSKHYTVDENPGMPEGSKMRAYYYYLMTMAKCFSALGVDTVVDAAGKTHDWRADLIAALAKRQQKDGSWRNETVGFQEGNSDLCTAYALTVLSYCRPKGK